MTLQILAKSCKLAASVEVIVFFATPGSIPVGGTDDDDLETVLSDRFRGFDPCGESGGGGGSGSGDNDENGG
jgi:hypothetical protein